MSLENNIPEFLKDKLKIQYGEDILNKILNGYNVKRKTTLRINTLKSSQEEIKEELAKANIEYKEVSWSKDALIIENAEENKIRELEIYDLGKIYLQSLSSMLPPIILEPKENENILDMAAAPGGKTTQIAALTGNKANITACEMNNIRAEKLKYNIEKQGAKSVYVMVTDSRRIDNFFSFDRILLDAPCSGSGTLNVDDKYLEKNFTLKLVNKSSMTQIALLKKALKILKPGKEMIYSTCSILEEENEETVRKVLKEENAQIVPIDFEGIEEVPLLPSKIKGTLCVCPTDLYEGFFVAKIRKNK